MAPQMLHSLGATKLAKYSKAPFIVATLNTNNYNIGYH